MACGGGADNFKAIYEDILCKKKGKQKTASKCQIKAFEAV
jgi:hypothetical protein